ncbi:hypothetical protein, partial [Streptomyces sp. DSM 41534]
MLRHLCDGDCLGEMVQYPRTRGGQRSIPDNRYRRGNILCLSPVAMRWGNQRASYPIRGRGTKIPHHHVQAHVDPAAHSGRSQDITVVDIEDIPIDLHRWKQRLELPKMLPMR